MQRLFVANRGEIAIRVLRTAQDLGLECISCYATEDEALAKGYGATHNIRLPGRGAAAYLDIDAIVAAAREQKCDAVHPGYGFLSESAPFAQACEAAGLIFVGPTPETLALFGDKARARELATKHEVPVVPGLPAPVSVADVEGFIGAAKGAPVLLKAVAGGGGRGMRRVSAGDDLQEAFDRCRSEAERSFGSGELFVERLVEGARHIEVQVIADRAGNISHLWERDCSLQRRHQKLIEQAPATNLSDSLRSKLIHAALTLAKAADYQGVGTFEFLVSADESFFFIEANPRLQVEHTVTEEVTGVDLVELQLGIAAGKSLHDLGVAEPPPVRGHAIQLRILAETMKSDGTTRPSGDTIGLWRPPSGPGVRVDSAIRSGLAAHPAFDSMIAKLIVSTADSDPARTLRRAQRALTEFEITGPRTNLAFLAALLERPEMNTALLTTTFMEAHLDEILAAADLHAEATETALGLAPAQGISAGTKQPLAPGLIALRAPLIGTVIELNAAPGQHVEVGDSICVLESMKMEHVVHAECEGLVDECFVALGDVVAEAGLLVALSPSGKLQTSTTQEAELDLNRIRPDLAALQAREELLQDEARPKAVERRRSRGQRTARENLVDLCDPGTFTEYGGLAVAAMRKVRDLDDLQKNTPADAIITGTATVNGTLFDEDASSCALLVVDATVLAGTQGFFHHKKIDRILEIAEHGKLPVIFYPEGGGGRPNDTDASDLVVAGLNITSFSAFAALSGKVPRVAVVSGFCFAGSAAFAGCADVIIATKNACLGMGGPAMIEGGGLGVFEPKEIGPVSVQEKNGVLDLVVEDEQEAAVAAKKYLSYFQGTLSEWTAPNPLSLRHVIPENRRRIYDVRELIAGLCDTGSVMELRRAYGPGMITAFVRIEGRPIGLIANDPMYLGGAIDDTGAQKAARFLQLCDAFGFPVLSLCDTPGFMVGPEIEERAQVRKVSRLFVVGANISVPLFCVITRKGYGLGAQAMAGGGFSAPFDCVAWPTGEIGGMGLEGAVNLGFKKQLAACKTEEARTALFEKLVGVMYEKGKALNAASALEYDAVIDPAETRQRILKGLRAYGPVAKGQRNFVDTW